MDLINLKAFIAIAKTNSFTKAANCLHITQSAVSKRMSSLQSELKAKLVERCAYGYRLTEAGQLFLPFAESAIESVEKAKKSILAMSYNQGSEVTMCLSYFFGAYMWPKFLKNITAACPDTKLTIKYNIYPIDSFSLPEASRTRIAISIVPHQRDAKFVCLPLTKFPMKFIVNKSHPLASKENVTLADLAKYAAVLCSRLEMPTREDVEMLFKEYNLPLNVYKEIDHFETMRNTVRDENCWAIVPEPVVNDEVVTLNVPMADLNVELNVVYESDTQLSAAERQLIEAILAAARTTNQPVELEQAV